MSAWYYADRNRNRQGPVESAALARLFREGRLQLDSLVWREGLANWQPLGDFAAELGLLEDAPVAATPAAERSDVLSPESAEVAFIPTTDEAAGEFGRAVFTARESEHGDPSSYEASGASPYAAPSANLTAGQIVHRGGEVVHAGLWKRFAASIIDGFVTGAATYVVLIPLMLIFGLSMGGLAGSENPFAGGAGALLSLLTYPISFGIPAIYFGWMHASARQASLGKMAVGIKVVRGNGEAISFWRGFLRYLAYMLFTLVTCGLGVLISGLMVAFTERKQAPHDMICDTLVVDKWAFTAHPEWQRRELGTVTIAILALGGLLIVGAFLLVLFAIGIAASAGR